MATITEDYVSFETAKLLKEKGFNERLLTLYITDEVKKEGCFQLMAFTDDKIDNNHSDHCYLAPTLQMAMKWLREVHNIHFLFDPYLDEDYNIRYSIIVVFGTNVVNPIYKTEGDFTYEQACETAMLYCLENLI